MCDTEVDKSQPPEFLTRPKPLNVTEGSSAATFTCRVQGHPPPTVSWECNGCPLSTNERCKVSQEGDRHSLEILGPRSVDSGQYVCQVHNSAGRISHTCSLTLTPASSTTPGAASVPAGPLDFRAVLKPRPSSGQLRPQRSLDWDRPDKENHVTDFRHVLLKNRKNSLPLSTTSNTTSTTSTATSGFSRRMVPTGLSTSSSASSVSGSASGRVGGVKKNLKLFEKQATASTDRSTVTSQRSSAVTSQRSSAVTSRRSASPDHQPLPHRTGLTSRDSPCPDTGPSPVRDVKDSAVRDRRREDRVADSVLTQSTVHTSLAAPTTSRERSRERMARHPKIAAAHTTFSKSLDRSHWRGAEPTDTDFRSVFSKPQAATDRSKVSTDSKPSWARPNSSREQRRNGHSKDVKQTTSGKVDFRSVLKPRQSEDSGQSSSMSRDGKPTVQSSQSATDFRAVLSKPKHGGDDRKPAPSKPAQSRVAAGRSPMNKSLPSKGLHSVRSKFETSAQDSNSVQSKAPRPLTTTTTTTKNVMVSGQSGTATSESTSTSRWKDGGGQDRLALKEEDNTTEDISSGKERRRDRIPAKVENTSEDISDSSATANWKERRRDRIPAKVENTSEDISDSSATANWKERRRDRMAAKVLDDTTEDISDSSATANWKERRRERLAQKVENMSEDISDSSTSSSCQERLAAKVLDTTVEDKAPDIMATLSDVSRYTDDLKCSDSSQLSDSAISSTLSKLSELSDLSDSSSAISEVEAQEPPGRRRLARLKGRLGGGGGEDSEREAPSIVERLEDRSVTSGSQVLMQCRVSGVPLPTISWTHNNNTIKPSRFFQLSYQENLAKLLVAEAFSEDEGEYTCTVTNSAGTDSCSCYLAVKVSSSRSSRSGSHMFEGAVSTPPRVGSLTPASQTVRRGQPVTFQMTFSGIPSPVVTWYLGKTALQTGGGMTITTEPGSSTLTIPSTEANNSGRYTVTLTNDLGSDEMSATLSVEDVPECPVGMPHVYDISSTSVSLSWCGPAYDGGSVITHYVIEVKDTHSNQWSTLTDDCQSTSYHALTLKPDTFYQFRVRASNRLGLSEPSLPTSSVAMTDPLQTSVDYESDDELPFEPKEVTLTPGRKFEDHYEYLHEVGRGKFGSVYKCRDKQTGKIWAAKVLKVREKEKAVVRGEVEVMNRLAHPKLLMLWDAFEAPRTMVLVMEFVGAGELFERVIREDFVLTERDCVHFVRQICIGVGYMHSKSILHLDLKPENVLCVAENSNQIKIIDFGLARFYKPGDSLQVLFGTPEFIAPEVINYDSISFATDMWSIGVICYILLTGLSPFLGDNDAETLANVTSGEYDFDDDSFEDISDRAKDFINRLLIKQQEKRQTITECEKHTWLSEEDERIRCKRLNTDRLRTFMARRKWQKTGNAIRALGRMASLQKLLLGGSTSSSGSLSSNPDAHSAAPCAVSTPVFSPPVHQPSSAHPLSSAAVREVEEKRGEAASTSTTSRKGGDCEKGDSSSAAESDSDCRKSATAATDRKSSPPSWRKAKREGAAKDAESTNPSGRSKRTQQDALCDITQTAPPDEPASATTTKTTTKRQTDRASPRRTPAEPEDGSPCPPRFVKEMVDCRAFRDDAVRFDVTVTGRPPPHVEWLMEEEVVAVDERHCVEQGEGGHWSLIVRHVDEDDDGEYQCRAVNSQGEACCSADLSVYSLGAI